MRPSRPLHRLLNTLDTTTLTLLLDIAPFEWSGILASVLAGSIVGTERQLLGKPCGIRTSSLIVLGTYLFIALAGAHYDGGDGSRVLGQIVTGIGFLGAGVILAKDGIVLGVTSAAAIWSLAAIGAIIGEGHHLTGVKLAVLVVLVLVGVDLLEHSFSAMRRGVHAQFGRLRRK